MKQPLVGFLTMFVLCVLIAWQSYRSGIFDRLKLRTNTVDVNVVRDKKLRGLCVKFVCLEDTFDIYKRRTLAVEELRDWYGKDHLVISLGSQIVKCTYHDFKFRSWEKVKVKIDVSKSEFTPGYYIINTKLRTIYKEVTRQDSLYIE